MKKHQGPRGTQDLFGEEIKKWHVLEEKFREFARLYGLSEIRTPEFEHTEVFARGNDSSDVVNKEMYTFEDRGGRSMTLKPEGTAGLVRSVIEHKLYANPEPYQKYYYVSPVFRYDRPQKGRLRIHHQFGIEIMGEKNALLDVETILIGLRLVESLGLKGLKLHINTLGDDQSRDMHRESLKTYFKPHLAELCSDCHRRYEQNPLRILDCKIDGDKQIVKDAPTTRNSLNEESETYFNEVLSLLDELEIDYVIDDKIVRGLDYYTHTVFEVIPESEETGSQSTIFGGGRYDHLVENLGGPSLSSVGFGMGIERLLLTLEAEQIELPIEEKSDVYGISLGESTVSQMMKLVDNIRASGLSAQMDYSNRSLKAQFKSADRIEAKMILILGEDEMKNKSVNVKNTKTQEQQEVAWDQLVEHLRKELQK